MSGSSTLFLGIAGALAWGVGLLVELVFIVVVVVLVRPRRPDAAAILLLGLGLELLFSLASIATQLLLPRLIMGSGADMKTYAEAQGLSTLAASLGHAVARALLIWGVVRLASEKPVGAAAS